jgi:drug/metabolite transporter (DMT)-like permease
MKFSRGALYMILAAFSFSVMAAFVKVGGSRLPSQEIVLFRSIVVWIITAVMIKRLHLPLWGKNKKLLFLRGFTGFLGLSAFYFTLTQIPIADSITIQYTNPLFTALLAVFMLKERSSTMQWAFFLLAFTGVVFIVRPGYSIYTFPALIGLGGAFCAGLAYNLIRILRKTDHPLNIILYLPTVSIVLSIPLVIHNFTMPVGIEWLVLLAIGITTQIAQIFLTKSLHIEKAARATNVSYVSIIFATMFGLIFWGEIPDWRTAIGASLVIIAVVQIAREPEVRHGKRSKH